MSIEHSPEESEKPRVISVYGDEDGHPVVWVTNDGEGHMRDGSTGKFLPVTRSSASSAEQTAAFDTLVRRTPDVD